MVFIMILPDVERDGLQVICWEKVYKHYATLFEGTPMNIARYLINQIQEEPERVIDIFRYYNPELAERLVELGGLK